MMRQLKHMIICCVFGLASLNAAAVDIASKPVFLNPPDPRLMLVLSRDHELSKKAYTDYSSLRSNGTLDISYVDAIEYYGYFDTRRCYSYNSGAGRFEPSGLAGGTYSHHCSGEWSGNFLNWVSMTRMDVLRKTLYGGLRSTDNNGAALGDTVLERAMLPNDVHAFAKVFKPAGGATEVAKYTPYSQAAVSFCNVSPATTGMSRSTTTAPKLQVALGEFNRWAMSESKQCGTGGTGKPSALSADLTVRVVVCAPGKLESNCTAYGSNWKPTGLLQKYGQSDSPARVKFGLLTGSYSKNKSGGMLRKNTSWLNGNVNASDDEINGVTGVFINQAATDYGIINTLNRLRISSWNFGDGKYGDNCGSPGVTTFNNGECTDWGNPLGEMYLESMRYFAGKSGPMSTYDTGSGEQTLLPSLPKVTWSDPLPAAEWCALSNTVVLSTGLNSFDGDELSGHDITGLDVEALTNRVGALEGLTGSYLVGGNGSTADGQCTPKSVSSLGQVRGICPEVPSLDGSYHIAGLAFANQNLDLRPEYAAKRSARWGASSSNPNPGFAARQPMGTYSVALAESLPSFDIPVSGGAISFLPSCMANSTGGAISNANPPILSQSTGWRVCSLTDLKILSLAADGKSGTFEAAWEDSTWGSDYDMDGVVQLDFCVGSACSPAVSSNQLKLTAQVVYANAGHALRFGYTVTGSTQDGTYLDILRRGGVTVPALGPRDGVTGPTSRTFTIGSSSAKLLNNPLWYAAKHGKASWDEDNNGIPDNYFKVTNPAGLIDALGKVFEETARSEGSASAIASNSTRLDTSTHVYQALFQSPAWSGQLWAIPLTSTGAAGTPSWEAGARIPAAAQRNILTWSGGAWNAGAGAAFTWAGLTGPATTTGTQQNLLGSEDVLNYIRGVQSKEVGQTGGTFRRRTTLLGDIINSDPHYVAAETYGYDQPASGLSETERLAYTSFLTAKTSRPPMLYVGANDGMLHAINAANTQSAGGGVESFAYVPNAVIPNLKNLSSPDYVHRYYVDGPPNSGDAYLNGSWKTVLVSSLGAGGKGLFALDVTNPGSFDSSKVIWEYVDSATPGDLGFVMHRPQIARMNDGHWYAIFGNGYNSTNQKAILYFVPLDKSSSSPGVFKLTLDNATGGDNGLSEPALLDTDGDRIIDYVYAGDLKGNVWKVDVSNRTRSQWDSKFKSGSTPEPFFVAKRDSSSGSRQPITGPLEIGVPPSGSSGYMIYFGTGRYLGAGDVTDTSVQTVYGVLDKGGNNDNITTNPGRNALQAQSFVYEGPRSSSDPSVVRVASNNAVNYSGSSAKRGWYLDLVSPNTPAARGERVVSFPLLRHGRVIFTSVVPSPALCEQGGYSWITELDAISGARLTYSVFDYTRDGLYNGGDYASYSNTSNPVSSKQLEGQGLLKSPAVISAGEKEYKVGSGTAGGVIVVDEKGMDGTPRSSWRQIFAQ